MDNALREFLKAHRRNEYGIFLVNATSYEDQMKCTGEPRSLAVKGFLSPMLHKAHSGGRNLQTELL